MIVEHFLDLDRQDEERRAEALRPKAEDRAAVPGLLRRLARRTPEERAFLVEVASPFASWALAERLAHGTAEAGDDDLRRLGASIERTRLAVQIAGQVAGPKSWKDRVLGYTRAFLAQELRAAGDNQAAQEAAAEAERSWEAGLDDEGLLDEGRFRKALGAGVARH